MQWLPVAKHFYTRVQGIVYLYRGYVVFLQRNTTAKCLRFTP